ncbi:DUF2726 domain-containing protein [Candidatus Beckwithbacteria bacterium]|nr:DUF2726 domain-containing protein [Candidatus Beckwithbacteria bacterium]
MNEATVSIFTTLTILLIVGFVIKLFLRLVFQKFPRTSKSIHTYLYKTRSFFLTKPEHELFDILVKNFGDTYYIFPQVHLSSIFNHKIKGQNWQSALNHIDRKSIDFLFCDKAYIKPILAIELDDSSHQREDRIIRDSEVEQNFENANLPLLRFNSQERFHNEEMFEKIREKL